MLNIGKKRVLVTGADGFIGSHLVEALVQQGCEVKAFVMYNSFGRWGWLDTLPVNVLDAIEVVAGDIRDAFFVEQAMEGCDIVFHLAALIAIPYSYVAPSTYVETNINGTLNVLQSARKKGIDKLIHTSTSEVYGSAQYVPIAETHPLNAQSPYAATKIAADQLAMSFYSSFGTPVAIARPFNTYGPRQSARAVIPATITQIASGKNEILLGALHPTRDFNYVTDTVDGFIKIAKSNKSVGEVLNVGSGYETSIEDLVKLISRLMNKEIEVRLDESRLRPERSEVDRLLASSEKARRLVEWNPQILGEKGLEEGLLKTIEWFSNPKNISFYKADIYNI